MKSQSYHKLMLGLGLAGTLFAGYLSGVKIFSKTCAFGETCPIFLGFPSCYYGFAMFFAMFAIALAAVIQKREDKWPAKTILKISILGTLFAGYFTVAELPAIFSGNAGYSLGLPTCAYGLVFYIAMLVISARQFKKGPPKVERNFDGNAQSVRNDRDQIGFDKKSTY